MAIQWLSMSENSRNVEAHVSMCLSDSFSVSLSLPPYLSLCVRIYMCLFVSGSFVDRMIVTSMATPSTPYNIPIRPIFFLCYCWCCCYSSSSSTLRFCCANFLVVNGSCNAVIMSFSIVWWILTYESNIVAFIFHLNHSLRPLLFILQYIRKYTSTKIYLIELVRGCWFNELNKTKKK